RHSISTDDGGAVLYLDRVSSRGTMLVTSLDPLYHYGSYFMPATERFLDGFLPWVTRELPWYAATHGCWSVLAGGTGAGCRRMSGVSTRACAGGPHHLAQRGQPVGPGRHDAPSAPTRTRTQRHRRRRRAPGRQTAARCSSRCSAVRRTSA